MDYEKLYKEALERATKLAFTGNISATAAGEIFNELKESKDEKIRKEIYRYFRDLQLSSDREFSPSISVDEILAWLEKQDIKLQEYIDEERNKKDFYCEGKEMSWNEMPLGVKKHDYPYYFKGDLDCYPFNVEKQNKQKPIEQDMEVRDLWVYIREWNDKFGRLPKDEDELAACIDYVMKRQKPSDKVEPKFKVGDWVQIEKGNTMKVLEVNENTYKILSCYGFEDIRSISDIDCISHLWTIQDAKKGDILQANKCTLIFDSLTKDIDGNTVISSWYFCDTKTFYGWGTSQSDLWSIEGVVPATKEQHDFFFKKMHEAGYEWDAEKKELRTVEQESTWSEEDEKFLVDTMNFLYRAKNQYAQTARLEECIDWLKSLKPQKHWKPSEEQMEALFEAKLASIKNREYFLGLLYEDLKKL